MGDEKFLLTLEIAGRKYPLRIKRSDEQAFREAAKRINIKINQYRVAYGEITPHDDTRFFGHDGHSGIGREFYSGK